MRAAGLGAAGPGPAGLSWGQHGAVSVCLRAYMLVRLSVCVSACPYAHKGQGGGHPSFVSPHDAMEHLTCESSLCRLTPKTALKSQPFPEGKNPAALPKPAQTLWAPIARLLQDFWQSHELGVGSALLWMSLAMGPEPKVGWPYPLPAWLHSTSSLGLLPACG